MDKKIHLYNWEGVDKLGNLNHGSMEAPEENSVKKTLRKQGIIPRKIIKKHAFSNRNKTIKQHDVMQLVRQIASLVRSGIPLIQVLEIILKNKIKPNVETLVKQVKQDVASGITLSESLQKHPNCFDTLSCNLINIGEKSGKLSAMLDNLVAYKETLERTKQKAKQALIYPCAVVALALSITMGLLFYVIPQFESLFNQFHAELPQATLSLIAVSQYLKKHWQMVLSALVGASYACLRSQYLAKRMYRILLALPIIGPLFSQAAIMQFSRSLSITLSAGLPLVDALYLVIDTLKNHLYVDACNRIQTELAAGEALHIAMERTKHFPSLVIHTIATGEETGNLESSLRTIADFYERELESTIATICQLLEPLMITILGLFIGLLMLVLYLPIIKMGAIV